MATKKNQANPPAPGKTKYKPRQIRRWKEEMESNGDANSTYFYEDNDQ